MGEGVELGLLFGWLLVMLLLGGLGCEPADICVLQITETQA